MILCALMNLTISAPSISLSVSMLFRILHILSKLTGPNVNILNELIENADIVRFIKSRRIAWLGLVMRMDDRRTAKEILEWKPIVTRIRGRPRK